MKLRTSICSISIIASYVTTFFADFFFLNIFNIENRILIFILYCEQALALGKYQVSKYRIVWRETAKFQQGIANFLLILVLLCKKEFGFFK